MKILLKYLNIFKCLLMFKRVLRCFFMDLNVFVFFVLIFFFVKMFFFVLDLFFFEIVMDDVDFIFLLMYIYLLNLKMIFFINLNFKV